MWPFKKKPKAAMESISCSQVDFTERFGDDQCLGPDDWIETVPLNTVMNNPDSMGLPPVDSSDDGKYRIASKMSAVREMFSIPNSGVYCPICHIANIDLGKLRTPCPKCGRDLLKFGWD